MSVTNMLGKPLKHYAVDKDGRTRYFMLAIENETDSNTCSVIEMDKMDSELRAELTEIINSDECQREVDVWRILDTKFFMNYPKQTILSVLRALKVIKVLPTEDVYILLPNDARSTAKEVMKCIREYREKEKQKKIGIITDNPLDRNDMVDSTELNKVKEDVKRIDSSLDNINKTLESLVELVSEMKKPSKK